jgi:hypothetical protein
MYLKPQHPNTKKQAISTELKEEIKDEYLFLLARILYLVETYTRKFQ